MRPDISALQIGRLRRRVEFVATAKGIRMSSGLFTVQASSRSDGGGARIGLTVTRKVGGAVERNRIRRRLRAATQAAFAAPGAAAAGEEAIDYVIVARRAALSADYASLVAEFAAALRRAPAKLSKVRGAVPGNGNG